MDRLKGIIDEEQYLRVSESIKTEIDTLKVCQHPYVVKLYEIIETPSYIFLIMEYVKGQELYQYILLNFYSFYL